MNAKTAWLGAAACAWACGSGCPQASAAPVTDDDLPAVVSTVDMVRENGISKRRCPSQAASAPLSHPTLPIRDGKYSMSLTALVQADAATFDGPEVAGRTGSPAPSRSGFDFRRAQLGVQGRLGDDFGYRFNYDFSNARPQSAFVSFRGLPDPFLIRIGAFPTPANLADATATDDLLFAERPSPAELSRGLDAGDARESIGIQGSGNIWYLSSYLTSDTLAKPHIVGQKAYVGRVALAPLQGHDNDFTLHVGGNVGYVFDPAGAGPAVCAMTSLACYPVSLSDRPELREWNTGWIGTGNVDAKSAYSAGVEGAVGYGPFLVEGEGFRYGIDRRRPVAGQTSPDFSGWYVEGSWVLSGENRAYSMGNAAFLRPVPASNFDPPAGSWGAWELALRYSDANLDYEIDSPDADDQVRGGDQHIYSAGLNFYPGYNLKFMFQWQNVDIRRPWSGAFDTRYNAFAMRAQVSL